MIKAFTIGKILIAGTFAIVVFLAWKSVRIENMEAKQVYFENRMSIYDNRMAGYDRNLEDVRVESRVSAKLLEQVKADTNQIKQILLNQKR